jgi:hypothetical protein
VTGEAHSLRFAKCRSISRKVREFTKPKPKTHVFSVSYEWHASCVQSSCDDKAMMRISRSPGRTVVFSLSGRIEAEDTAELKRLLSIEPVGQDVAFDLQEITLVDREAVKFLARCEEQSIKLENCPAYIREWIERERGGSDRQKG